MLDVLVAEVLDRGDHRARRKVPERAKHLPRDLAGDRQQQVEILLAPAAVLERICRPMLEAGKTVMVLSAGALLKRPELMELAKANGGQIIVPTGALLGLDAVTAAADRPQRGNRRLTDLVAGSAT